MKYLSLHIFLFFPLFIIGQEKEQQFSLYFENDKYELTTSHLKIIDSINLAKHKEELDIHIKGYTNSIGDSIYNLKLSNKRANSVKERLREFTIISTQGHGELGSEAAKNRRVDILVHLKSDHIPEKGEIVEPPKIPPSPPPIPAAPTVTKKIPAEVLKLKEGSTYKKGDKIILLGIYFYKNIDTMKDESKASLTALISFLEKNKNIKFKLIGHICCGDPLNRKKDLKNLRTGKVNLSEARAKSLYTYLKKQGINKKRMSYIGMAYTQPTGKSDKMDRRVEIEITSVE